MCLLYLKCASILSYTLSYVTAVFDSLLPCLTILQRLDIIEKGCLFIVGMAYEQYIFKAFQKLFVMFRTCSVKLKKALAETPVCMCVCLSVMLTH